MTPPHEDRGRRPTGDDVVDIVIVLFVVFAMVLLFMGSRCLT